MKYIKLCEIAEIKSGGTPSRNKKEYWEDGSIPWIKIRDIQNKYVSNCSEYITEEGLNNSSAKLIKSGSILYTIFATLGETAILNIDATTNQAIAGITVTSTLFNRDYIYYYLKSKKCYVNNIGRGVAQNNINMSILKGFEVPCVSIEEQQNIVNVLSKAEKILNDKIEQINKLDNLVKSRFVEMFGDPIINPKKWKVTTIGNVVTEVRYGTSKPAVEGGKYPYLRMNNLTYDGHLDLKDLKYIDIPDEEIEKCVVRKGDILFNRTNSIDLVGKTTVFDMSEDMVIAGYIIRVRLKEELLPEILSQYMNLEAIKKILRSMAKGAVNQANINAQELQKINIYIPDIELQKEFIKTQGQINKSKFD